MNGDFDRALTGWQAQPAEPGSLGTRHIQDLSWIEGRYPKTDLGNNVCVMKRSAMGPNRLSQTVRALTPGRAYALRLFSADPNDLRTRKETGLSVDLSDAEIDPGLDFVHVFRNPWHGTEAMPRGKVWMSYHFTVFRPQRATVKLTISDWAGADEPGGPIGQETVFNFVQVRPYLDE